MDNYEVIPNLLSFKEHMQQRYKNKFISSKNNAKRWIQDIVAGRFLENGLFWSTFRTASGKEVYIIAKIIPVNFLANKTSGRAKTE